MAAVLGTAFRATSGAAFFATFFSGAGELDLDTFDVRGFGAGEVELGLTFDVRGLGAGEVELGLTFDVWGLIPTFGARSAVAAFAVDLAVAAFAVDLAIDCFLVGVRVTLVAFSLAAFRLAWALLFAA